MKRHPSTIRVEPLDNPTLICGLVNAVWSAEYASATVMPNWTPTFFDWQFLSVPAGWPAICLGIYLGDALVGVYCGDCWPLVMDGNETRATLLSCISVAPEARHPSVAEAGLNGLREWSEAQESHYFVGFVNPASSAGAGRRYWTTRRGYRHAFSTLSRQWQINPMTVPEASGAGATGCRMYEIEDGFDGGTGLNKAATLLCAHTNRLAERGVATLVYSDARLRHQLRFGSIARAVVIEMQGAIGVCSYYVLPTHAGGRVGFFDHIAASTPEGALADQAFACAIARMKAEACDRAFVLGRPNHDDALLSRLGFRPCFPSYAPLIVSWDPSRPLPRDGAFCPPIYR